MPAPSTKSHLFETFKITPVGGGQPVEIAPGVVAVEYREDIFSPQIDMKVQVLNTGTEDGLGLYNSLPIRGGEAIEFIVKSGPRDGIDGGLNFSGVNQMVVYKISDIFSDTKRESFTLHCTSKESWRNMTTKVYRKFDKNTKVDQAVRELLQQDLVIQKRLGAFSTSQNSIPFIGNSRSPYSIISWLCPKAIPSASTQTNEPTRNNDQLKGSAGFFFWESRDTFEFKSIEDILASLAGAAQETFTYTEKNDSYGYGAVLDNFKKIREYSFERDIDINKDLTLGVYNSTCTFFNPRTFRIKQANFHIKENYNQYQTLNQRKEIEALNTGVIPDNQMNYSRVMSRVIDLGVLDNEGKNDGNDSDSKAYQYIAQSIARFNYLFRNKLFVTVSSNPYLRAGDVVELKFPETRPHSNFVKSNEPQGGKYVIKSIVHYYHPTEALTTMSLIRDSYPR